MTSGCKKPLFPGVEMETSERDRDLKSSPKEMATHSSILPWRIPQTEEAGELQSMGSQSWTQLRCHCTHVPTRQPRDPTRKSQWCRQKKMIKLHRGTHAWASFHLQLPHLQPFCLIPRKTSFFFLFLLCALVHPSHGQTHGPRMTCRISEGPGWHLRPGMLARSINY